MDFKRIEWIFLVVFIGINIFLVIELWQTPTLLSAHSTPTQTDIKSETSADQITIPKVNDKQGDGYYLAAKVDNSWSKKAAAQINEQVETNASDNSISVNLNKPVTISKKQKEALKEVIRFKIIVKMSIKVRTMFIFLNCLKKMTMSLAKILNIVKSFPILPAFILL